MSDEELTASWTSLIQRRTMSGHVSNSLRPVEQMHIH
jgi:hypothetical protein